MALLVRLYLEFFKTGLFAVGGGLATLPFLKELADKTGWFTQMELTNMIAISESTPGPIGINASTYVGFTSAGLLGAVVATLGLITPSIIVIICVAKVLAMFKESKLVKNIFYGLRPASAGLIAAACVSVVTIAIVHIGAFQASGNIADLVDIKALILAGLLLYFTGYCKKTKGLHPVAFLAVSALVGVLLNFAGV